MVKQKASAVCAREPLWFVHKRRRKTWSGSSANLRMEASEWLSNNRDRPRARLLSDVYLLFFVYVAQEINQSTDKRDCCQSERDPTRSVPAGRVRISHKLIEVPDRADGSDYTHNHRQNVFQAFHFEPPARDNMKVKEKAAVYTL
jgi:hypothetical protein